MQGNYVLITPCRDEAAYAQRAIDSVLAQTLLPQLWVIVDDGSTDATPAMVMSYAQRYPFIRVLRREDRGRRQVGPGVVHAFNAGLQTVDLKGFEFLCKLDLDVVLPPRYFEELVTRMRQNPRLGTCSGKPWYLDRSQRLRAEVCGDEMSVGMTKFYRVACFQDIGGFVPQVMWDGIDCHRCRMLGWEACSFDDPSLTFIHLRPMGGSEGGLLRGRMRHGFGQYFMGTPWWYMLASCLFRFRSHPAVLGSAAMLWGYLHSALTAKPRYDDAQFRSFLTRFQWNCLTRGKREAARMATLRGPDADTPAEARLSGALNAAPPPRQANPAGLEEENA